jgi:hypothetical protein
MSIEHNGLQRAKINVRLQTLCGGFSKVPLLSCQVWSKYMQRVEMYKQTNKETDTYLQRY